MPASSHCHRISVRRGIEKGQAVTSLSLPEAAMPTYHSYSVFPLSLKVPYAGNYSNQMKMGAVEIPSRLRWAQVLILRAKLILSLVEQLGGELENQIYCFIKDKHSIWRVLC